MLIKMPGMLIKNAGNADKKARNAGKNAKNTDKKARNAGKNARNPDEKY